MRLRLLETDLKFVLIPSWNRVFIKMNLQSKIFFTFLARDDGRFTWWISSSYWISLSFTKGNEASDILFNEKGTHPKKCMCSQLMFVDNCRANNIATLITIHNLIIKHKLPWLRRLHCFILSACIINWQQNSSGSAHVCRRRFWPHFFFLFAHTFSKSSTSIISHL